MPLYPQISPLPSKEAPARSAQHPPARLRGWRDKTAGPVLGQQAGHGSRNLGDFQLQGWEGNKWVRFIGHHRVQNYSEEERC